MNRFAEFKQNDFDVHRAIWEDCYVGYVILPNTTKTPTFEALSHCVQEHPYFAFYPWLNEQEQITLPRRGLRPFERNECVQLLINMLREGIAYGSNLSLSQSTLQTLVLRFIGLFEENATFWSNTEQGTWNPVTQHTYDSLVCVVDSNYIGMWLSCNDE